MSESSIHVEYIKEFLSALDRLTNDYPVVDASDWAEALLEAGTALAPEEAAALFLARSDDLDVSARAAE